MPKGPTHAVVSKGIYGMDLTVLVSCFDVSRSVGDVTLPRGRVFVEHGPGPELYAVGSRSQPWTPE